LPRTLLFSRVTIAGQDLPLLSVGPNQVNAQLPYGLTPGKASLTLSNVDSDSDSVNIEVQDSAPMIFVDSEGNGIVQNQDGSRNRAENPASVGSVLTTYCTGQGAVTPAPATGEAASVEVLSRTNAPFAATIGGLDAHIEFAGLAPGLVGLCQVNVTVPDVSAGSQPLQLRTGANTSNSILVAVQRSSAGGD